MVLALSERACLACRASGGLLTVPRSFVCEYAKICNPNIKVIASAGSAEKIKILKDIGVDVAINYKEQDVAKVLEEHGPIDMYVQYPSLSRVAGTDSMASVATGTTSPDPRWMLLFST